jgi:Co/Zn/Cd efflux system component
MGATMIAIMGMGGHGHTHGSVDPLVVSSERGIWAVKWSFVALFATALAQAVVVVLSGSVALLSDTIHNFGDAATAVPLWIAFAFARLGANKRFTLGYGRVEDLAWCSSSCSAPSWPATRPWGGS